MNKTEIKKKYPVESITATIYLCIGLLLGLWCGSLFTIVLSIFVHSYDISGKKSPRHQNDDVVEKNSPRYEKVLQDMSKDILFSFRNYLVGKSFLKWPVLVAEAIFYGINAFVEKLEKEKLLHQGCGWITIIHIVTIIYHAFHIM